MNTASNEHLMPEAFSVVVLYQDRETRDRVLDVSRHMALQVGEEIQLKFSWWRFDFLEDPDLARQAAHAATIADMLLVSAHPGRGFPFAFTRWVETWLPKRDYRDSVLVALIGSEKDAADEPASDYLRGIATRARMDYLAKPFQLSERAEPPIQRVEPRPSGLDHILRQTPPSSHWGINE